MVNVIFKGFCYLSLPILGVLACVSYISCKFGGMNSSFRHIHISILTCYQLTGLGVLHLGHDLLQSQTFAPQLGQVQLIFFSSHSSISLIPYKVSKFHLNYLHPSFNHCKEIEKRDI
jgi:hypothetical protein